MATVVRPFEAGRVSSVETASTLHLVLQFDDADVPLDVVDALLLPQGARLTRSARKDDAVAHLATGDGWTLRAVVWKDAGADATVTAVSEATMPAVSARWSTG
jgi:hypothetical protein